jgi:DNA-binding NarL/FixJ family response regulator
MKTPPITVLIADDHPVVREGLRFLLERETDISVVGAACDGQAAVQMAESLHPHVVLMDISMPQLDGLEATQRIRHRHPDVRVLILSAHSDDRTIERVVLAGASGFLAKESPGELFAAAIRETHQGHACFSPEIRCRLQNLPARNGVYGGSSPAPTLARLTCRELEVLRLIARGRANKQTANELGISIKTVEKHRQHVMEKLNIHDTAGLTRYAISAGLVETAVPSVAGVEW